MKKVITILFSGLLIFHSCVSADEVRLEDVLMSGDDTVILDEQFIDDTPETAGSETITEKDPLLEDVEMDHDLLEDPNTPNEIFISSEDPAPENIGIEPEEPISVDGFISKDDAKGSNDSDESQTGELPFSEEGLTDIYQIKNPQIQDIQWTWSRDEEADGMVFSDMSDGDETLEEEYGEKSHEESAVAGTTKYSAVISGKPVYVYYDENEESWVMPFSLEEGRLTYETLTSFLPDGIIINKSGYVSQDEEDESFFDENHKAFPILSWNCEQFKMDSDGNWPNDGNYTFTAVLEGMQEKEIISDLDIEVQLQMMESNSLSRSVLNLANIEECGDQLNWRIEEGTLYIGGTGDMYDYEIGEAPWYGQKDIIQELVLEDNVTSIGNYAFYALDLLTDVSVPKTVTRIGENAFAECISLKQITLPDCITIIEYRTFYHCKSLTRMQTVSPGDPEHVHTIQVISGRAPTCTEPGLTEGQVCSDCGTILVEQKEIPATGHSYGDWTTTSSAACVQPGEKTRTCSLCGETETESIPATGHKWKDPTFDWAEDYSSAKVKLICDIDGSHTLDLDASVATEVTPATCEKGGKIVYTASVMVDGVEYTDQKTTLLEETGHDYGDPSWSWSTDCSSAIATFTCINDPNHKETLTGIITSEITQEPSYSADGVRTYTATVDFNGLPYSGDKTESISKLMPNGTAERGLSWKVTDGVLTISPMENEQAAQIPDYDTADDAPWAEASMELGVSKVVVEEGITKIGSNAFTGLDSVNEIDLPRSLSELAGDSMDESALGAVKINYAGSKSEWDSLTQGTVFNDVEITSTHTHIWDSGKVTKAATTTAVGIKTFTCTDCGETRIEVIPVIAEQITITKKPSIKKPAASKNNITVKWSHFKHTSKKAKKKWKTIKKVQIQCAIDNGFSNIVKDVKIGKSKTKYTIKGLKKKTTYYVRVRYYDGTGYSNWSKVKKIRTK